ncbi:MAG: hypothetical protein KBD64_05440 [Gammaproteobacteria bacterium]|nr:hypothetical protein [Gammaproteobacteria bacterium]
MSRLSHELQEKIQEHLRTLQAQRKAHRATEETKRAAETAMTELTTIYSDFTSEEAFNAAKIIVLGEKSTGLGAIFHILFYPKLLMVLLPKLEENGEEFLRLLDFATDVNSGYGMSGTGEIFERADTLLFAATINPESLKLLLAAKQKASGAAYTVVIEERDFREQTILHKAAGYDYKTLQAVFQAITKEAQLQATAKGIDQDTLYKELKFKALSVRDYQGNTPLHYTSSVASIKMVLDDLEPFDQQTLLQTRNNENQTPLTFAEAMLATEDFQTTATQKKTTLPLAIAHLRSLLSIPAAASARAADDDVTRSAAASARAADDDVIDVSRSTADSTAIKPQGLRMKNFHFKSQ